MPGAPQPAKLKEGKSIRVTFTGGREHSQTPPLNTDFFKKGLIYVLGGGVSDWGAPGAWGWPCQAQGRAGPSVTTPINTERHNGMVPKLPREQDSVQGGPGAATGIG